MWCIRISIAIARFCLCTSSMVLFSLLVFMSVILLVMYVLHYDRCSDQSLFHRCSSFLWMMDRSNNDNFPPVLIWYYWYGRSTIPLRAHMTIGSCWMCLMCPPPWSRGLLVIDQIKSTIHRSHNHSTHALGRVHAFKEGIHQRRVLNRFGSSSTNPFSSSGDTFGTSHNIHPGIRCQTSAESSWSVVGALLSLLLGVQWHSQSPY